eukprot:TRINITY_DN9544_c0_g1_i1.p1 TRINITY_DN9544_c0_g1~~TRINITY_DN9544_c0_g1_i1.p1  ORF type:complete len:135 (-),score=20.61 TRINITY_DN9544_c0_g1_i1:130-534(-)
MNMGVKSNGNSTDIDYNQEYTDTDEGLEPNDSERKNNKYTIEWFKSLLHDPFVKKRKYTILASITLLLLGIIFLAVGIDGLFDKTAYFSGTPLSFVVVGGICLVPGAYGIYMIVNIIRKAPGFHFDQMPSYDDA